MSKKLREIRAAGADLYSTDFAKYLPDALKRDAKMCALAEAVTRQLLDASGEIENVLIYSRINELPEALVDILAYDMHVDWYDYGYPLEKKRRILKSSVRVHKKKGTKYAIEQALGSVYAQSEVEEWFQYGGQPHHFRIICDVTEDTIIASYQQIVKAVKEYKRLSSWMEEVTYQGRIYCTIYTHGDYFIYRNPMTGAMPAGTYPHRAVIGQQAEAVMSVGTEAAGFIFASPQAGTKPYRSVLFDAANAQIDVETALNMFRHNEPPAGRKRAGETPQRATEGVQNAVIVTAESAGAAYTHESAMAGQKNAGQVPAQAIKSGQGAAGVIVQGSSAGYAHTPPLAGTLPEKGILGGASVETASFAHKSKPCGSGRRL